MQGNSDGLREIREALEGFGESIDILAEEKKLQYSYMQTVCNILRQAAKVKENNETKEK